MPESAYENGSNSAARGSEHAKRAPAHAGDHMDIASKYVQTQTLREKSRMERSRSTIDRYQFGEKIGEGAFSVVYRAKDTHTGKTVAIKVIKKYQLDEKQRTNVIKEVNLMKQMHHPNIVELVEFIENDEYYYIIQELVPGGEIFNKIVNYTYFSEDLSRHIIIQLAEGLIYLHEKLGIVHRDLKPENVFFKPITFVPSERQHLRRSDNPATKKDEGKFTMNYGGGGIGIVKIGDFGLSKQLQYDNTGQFNDLKTPCGTVGYTAPEIVKDQKYSKEVDVWALGCILYILLCGFPPFFNDNIDELTRNVAIGKFEFLSPWWDEISPGAKHCVAKLLTVDPRERYTIHQFLEDPWIIEFLQRSQSQHEEKHKTVPRPLDSVYSEVIENPMDDPDGDSLKRFHRDDRGMQTPAVIAMKEAMDISNATMRERERSEFEKQVYKEPLQEQKFSLHLDESSILARRRKKVAV